MGILERKEREREDMRRLILNAARQLFLEQGYEKTSIRNIADVIEYSPSTIYLYYKDKNELFFALHEEAFLKLMEELSSLQTIQDSFARLIEMGHRYIKFAVENPELYDLMFIMKAPIEALACRDEVWEDGLKSFGLLKWAIQECVNSGYFKNTDIEVSAITIWSYMHGLVSIYLKNRMSMFQDNQQLQRMQQSFMLFTKMIKETL